MVESPNYGFNKNPTFTVNHISEYLTTENAPQRTRIIQRAKFPKKVEIAAYSQVRKALQSALCKPDFDNDGLGLLADRLADKARRESGYAKDEALRCEKAVRSFLETMRPRALAGMTFSPSPASLILNQCGVALRVTADALITCESKGTVNSGGLMLLYAFAVDREPMKDRLKAMTGLLLWALEGGQMEPLPKLCIAADMAEGELVKASPSHGRFRTHVTESCKEIASRWDGIEPPEDYDGPEWQ